MSKTLKLVLIVIFAVVLAAAFAACQKNVSDEYALEQEYPEKSYTFVAGANDLSVILSEISFVMKKGGVFDQRVSGAPEMISAEDLSKFLSPGVYNIGFTYNGLSVKVKITIAPAPSNVNYTATFYAGEGGYFQNIAGTTDQDTFIITTDGLKEAGKTAIIDMPVPKKVGYQFVGWYRYEDLSGAAIVSPYRIDYDQTLYARWINAEKRTVRFVCEGDQISTMTVEYNSSITNPPAARIYEGKVFTGWRYREGLYPAGTPIPDIITDADIVAVYVPLVYNVNYSSEVWESDKNFTIEYLGNFQSEPLVPAKTGYTGVWLDRATGKAPVYTNIMSNLNIYAYYTPLLLSIKFYQETSPDSGVFTLAAERNLDYGTRLINIPSYEEITGYRGEWRYLSGGGYVSAQPILDNPITRNYEIRSFYTILRYNVIFRYTPPSSVPVTVTQTYDYGYKLNAPIDLKSVFPTRYWSVTWYRHPSFPANQLVDFSTPLVVTGEISLYANPVQNDFIIEYRLPNLDAEGNPVTYAGDKLLRSVFVRPRTAPYAGLPAFTDAKYQIDGWTDVNGNPVDVATPLTDTIITAADPAGISPLYKLFAIVSIRRYNVEYFNMHIEEVENENVFLYSSLGPAVSVRYGTVIKRGVAPEPYDSGLLAVPVYQSFPYGDFKFDGWYTNTLFNKAPADFGTGFTVVGPTNFYAKWTDRDEGTPGLQFEFVPEDEGDGYYVVGGFDPGGVVYYDEIYIPRQHNDKFVRAISGDAFIDAYTVDIRNIIFSSNIRYIEDGTFFSLVRLVNFRLMESGSNYFTIEDGVLYKADYDGATRTGEGSLLSYPAGRADTDFQIPAETGDGADHIVITSIADSAFASAGNLCSLTFASGSSVVAIGAGAFTSCQNLVSVAFPATLAEIGEEAFISCWTLATVTCPPGTALRKVGRNAFNDTAWYRTPAETLILGAVLVRYSGAAAEFVVADGMKGIADGAFSTAANLTTLRVNAGGALSYIGNAEFGPKLKFVYLLKEAKIEVGPDTFKGVSANIVIYVPNSPSHLIYHLYYVDPNLDYIKEAISEME
jgi:Listeria-Bacteroides repeat domain (List_Bact_rpt).